MSRIVITEQEDISVHRKPLFLTSGTKPNAPLLAPHFQKTVVIHRLRRTWSPEGEGLAESVLGWGPLRCPSLASPFSPSRNLSFSPNTCYQNLATKHRLLCSSLSWANVPEPEGGMKSFGI